MSLTAAVVGASAWLTAASASALQQGSTNPPGADQPVNEAPVLTTVKAPTQRTTVMTMEQRWLRFTMASDRTLDMSGVLPSMYRGKFYRPGLEPKRRCIVKRESNGHYFSVSHNGYRGAYQMSAALARGATWMMLPEHEKLLGKKAANIVLAKLRKMPANWWPRYWQDAAFSTVHNWEGAGSGASHWYGGRFHC